MTDVRGMGYRAEEAGVALDDLAREGAQRMIAAALEAEAVDYVTGLVDEVDEAGRRLVVRNGRARARSPSGSGTVAVRAPRVNDKRVDEATGERQRFSDDGAHGEDVDVDEHRHGREDRDHRADGRSAPGAGAHGVAGERSRRFGGDGLPGGVLDALGEAVDERGVALDGLDAGGGAVGGDVGHGFAAGVKPRARSRRCRECPRI